MASVSCIDRPATVLSEDEMIDLLVDVHRSEGLLDVQSAHNHANEDYQRAVMASVLVKHGVTREQYDSSLMWYAKHLKLFVRVYSHVEEQLEEEHELWKQRMIEAREFAISQPGDSVELWTQADYLVLDSRKLSDYRIWNVESDENYRAGDTLKWSFDVDALFRGQILIASIAFRAREDDYESMKKVDRDRIESLPVGTASILIDSLGSYELVAMPDSLRGFGSYMLNMTVLSPDSIQSPVFLRNISLKRYHL